MPHGEPPRTIMSFPPAGTTHISPTPAASDVPPAVSARAGRWADRQALRVDGAGLVLFAALSTLYWGSSLVLASRKLMWNDELYTYYMAVLPTMTDVWAGLLTGAEQTPPLFYLLTRLAFSAFGIGHLSLRLPEILGVWVFSVCLLVFVRRRASWLPAACAAAFPLVTMAYYYALEARAYGVVLGFVGLALVCWQSVTLNRHRVLALSGLALSVAAAVSTHYYAVFAVAALALGEAVRSITTRRVDIVVWGALGCSVVPLALFLPLIRAGQSYSGAFWAPPQWVNIPDFYAHLLGSAVVPVAAILVVAVIAAAVQPGGRAPRDGRPEAATTLPELAVAAGFVLIPVLAVILAKLVTGAFTHRYALPAITGFAILAGVGVAIAFRRRPLLQLIAALALSGWFALTQAREFVAPTGVSQPVSSASIARVDEWVRAAAEPELPLVIADPHTFAVLSYYGSDEVRSRMVYLADADLALQHLSHNSVERGMLDLLGPFFGMRVMEFRPFMSQHARFLVYGDFVRNNFLNWILTELQQRGTGVELLNRQGDYLLLRATVRGDAPREAHDTTLAPR